jgi:hypothetical protein
MADEIARRQWTEDMTGDHDPRRLGQALGSIEDTGHEWDDDPAGWVRQQRAGGRAAGAVVTA